MTPELLLRRARRALKALGIMLGIIAAAVAVCLMLLHASWQAYLAIVFCLMVGWAWWMADDS